MNEPNLIKKKGFMDKVIEKQKSILVVAVVGLIVLFTGASYSMLTNFDAPSNLLSFEKDGLQMTVSQSGLIEMNKKVPEKDENGLINAAPIVLALTNTGEDTIMRFDVRIIQDETKNTTLSEEYIKYSISTDFGVSYSKPMLLKESVDTIYSGYNIIKDKSKTIYLKLWLDENAKDEALDKNYYGKVQVDLYKDSEIPYASDTIIKTLGNDKGVVAVNEKGEEGLDKDTVREYRYSGNNVDNYVKFNNEIWRIIGVFNINNNKHLKLVRNEILKEEVLPDTYVINENTYQMKKKNSNPSYVYWNNLQDKVDNKWENSGLSYYLNTEVDNGNHMGYLGSLSNEARSMIMETKYYLGQIYLDEKTNVKDTYQLERTGKSTWIGRIGLMYPSDALYSLDKSYWNTSIKEINMKIKNTSWIYESMKDTKNLQSWLLGTDGDELLNLDVSFDVSSTSTVSVSGVRPSLYLNSNVLIIRGSGTLDNPYILSL